MKVTVQPAVLVADDPNTEPDEWPDSSVVEEGGTASFAVELSGAVGVEVLVPYTTVDGSALAGADKDYTENSATLTFAPSDTSKTVEIVTRDDDLSEVEETFEVRLTATPTSLPEGVTVTAASATGTITDNDKLTAAVTADNPTVTEDQSATFTVTLTGGTSTAEVIVGYSLLGTATAGDDYEAPSGKLTIGAALGSGQIAIKTLQDNVLDRGETLEVRLDSATTDGAATVSETTAKTTITDPGTVQVSVTGLEVAEGEPRETVDKSSVEEGDPASFVVALSGPVQKTVEVSYATSDGTGSAATAGTDYTAADDLTLTFSSQETSKTVEVATTEDALNEDNETFTVTLTSVTLPDGVSLAANATTATGTIKNDDALTAKVTANAENVPGRQCGGIHGRADRRHQHRGRGGDLYLGEHGHGRHRLHQAERPADDHEARFERHHRDCHPDRRCPGPRRDAVGHADRREDGHRNGDRRHSGDGDHHHRGRGHRNGVGEGRRGRGRRLHTECKRVRRQVDRGGGGGSPSFIVELSGPVASTVEVAYATSSETGAGHAIAGTDYTAANGTLTFTSASRLPRPSR